MQKWGVKVGEEVSSPLEKPFKYSAKPLSNQKSFFSLSLSDKENVDHSKRQPPFHGAFHLRPVPRRVCSEWAVQLGGDGGGARDKGRRSGDEEGGSEGGVAK